VLTFLPWIPGARKKRIAVIPGDGIGKEVIPQAVNVMQAAGADLELTEFDWGADRYLADGPPSRPTASRCWPATSTPSWSARSAIRAWTNIHAKEILLGMRFKMDFYANVRPVRLLDASLCPLKGVEPKGRRFRRDPRKHRGRLHRRGRSLQAGHSGRDRDPGRHQHAQGRRAHHPLCVRVLRAPRSWTARRASRC
jgi:hypothetical protein